MNNIENGEIYKRNKWSVVETPIFTQERDFIRNTLKTKIDDN